MIGTRDPYLEWSKATEFAGHGAIAGSNPRQLPLLIEVTEAQRDELPDYVEKPPAYLKHERFLTVRVPRDQSIDFLKLVTRAEMALPIDIGAIMPGPVAPWQAADRPVIAVVDRDCAFLNPVFRNAACRTRFIAIWQQDREPKAGTPWQSVPGMGYGRELIGASIDEMLVPLDMGALGEHDLYQGADYLFDDDSKLLRTATHGTHVLDTIGGRVDPHPPAASTKPRAPDDAADAPLIFVDTPRPGNKDATGASSGVYWLDALKYIRLRAGPGVPVVVNISMGALAGPHDGTSLTERAISSFIEDDHHMIVVVAAGNSAREPWHVHGVLGKQGDGDDESHFTWRIQPEDVTDSFCELWFAPEQGAPLDMNIEVELVDPIGRSSGWTALGGTGRIEVGGPLLAQVLACHAGEGAADDAMVLLALAPSAAGDRRASVKAGLWQVRIRNRKAIPVKFDAWVQRDEPGLRGSGEVQSCFEAVLRGKPEIDGSGSLSSLATSPHVVVVGSTELDTRQPSPYSSRGVAGPPRRRIRDIDCFAPSDAGAPGMGLWAAGVLAGSRVRMGGTSVASPVAARRIYRWLVGELRHTQMPALTARLPRIIEGPWRAGLPMIGTGAGARPLLEPN